MKNIHRDSLTLIDILKAPIEKLSHRLFINEQLKWNEKLSDFISDKGVLQLITYDLELREFLKNAQESGYSFTKEQLRNYMDAINTVKVKIGSANNTKYYCECILKLLNVLEIKKIDYFVYYFLDDRSEIFNPIVAARGFGLLEKIK